MTTVTLLAGRELWNPPTDGISNLCFSNHSDHLLVFSWDKTVRLYDASANVLRGEFLHGGPCSIVASTMILRALVQVITGSWDKTLKCWDPRGASRQEHTLVGTYVQPERVYSLSLVGNRLLVTTTGRDGRLLAVASSYTFEEGQKPHEPDTIFLRSVNEVEVNPKPKRSPPLLE
nr:mitotic checkpoint protein BUB3.1 [Ipomoea batatas]